jgi:hypothetical protein
MLLHDDTEWPTNPNGPAILDWRQALQREWDADKRRRESHRSDPAMNLEAVCTSDALDVGAPHAKT